MPVNRDALIQLIESSGLVKKPDLDDAIKVSSHLGCDISDVLIGRNLISENEYGKILSQYFSVNFVNLDGLEIKPEIISILPEEVSAEKMAVVFDIKDNLLGLAVLDPTDLDIIETVKKIVGPQYNVITFVATSTSIKNALKIYKDKAVEPQSSDVKIDELSFFWRIRISRLIQPRYLIVLYQSLNDFSTDEPTTASDDHHFFLISYLLCISIFHSYLILSLLLKSNNSGCFLFQNITGNFQLRTTP